MRLLWRVWVGATTKGKVILVVERFHRHLGRETLNQVIEPYPKTGGFLVSCEIELLGKSWNECVIEAIAMAQEVASEWILTGDVYDDLQGWSNKSKVSGIGPLEWTLASEGK